MSSKELPDFPVGKKFAFERRPTEHDCRILMHQLAHMANISLAGVQRMVLVLDIEDIPKLYVKMLLQESEGFLNTVPVEPITADVEVDPDTYEVKAIPTTTVHNKTLKTFAPKPSSKVVDGQEPPEDRPEPDQPHIVKDDDGVPPEVREGGEVRVSKDDPNWVSLGHDPGFPLPLNPRNDIEFRLNKDGGGLPRMGDKYR